MKYGNGITTLTFMLLVFGAWSSFALEVESPGITAILRKYFPEGSKGGVAILATKNNVVVHSKGYGRKNSTQLVNSQTRMGLASVTKQFLAMCAAIQIEEGSLKLTDKVSKHLPELQLPRTGRELLVQDLLWHINGLPNFINSAERAAIVEYKKAHGLKRLSNETHADWLTTMKMRRAPGIAWEYTNSGYVLLARIIEVLAAKPFHEFQKERIFDVLGMSDSSDSASFNGSGNMMTTLEDYAKWDRAVWQGSLLEEKTAKLLFQSGTLDNGEPVGYGFGWKVRYEQGKLVEVEHGGVGSAPNNSRNLILRDMQNRITIAFFARENLKFTRAYKDKIVREMLSHVRGETLFHSGQPRTRLRAQVLAAIERMRMGKEPSISGGSLRSGLLKNAAQLPDPQGVGYYLAHPTRGSNFGNDRLVYGLMMLGAHIRDVFGDHPYHRLCVRDLSAKGGGKIKYHINHQMGLDADLTFFASDLQGNPVNSVYTSYGADGKSTKGDRRFDVPRNWELITGIIQNEFFGEIRAILVADPLKQLLLSHANAELRDLPFGERTGLRDTIQRAEKLMRQPTTSPHDNHFHLSLKLE